MFPPSDRSKPIVKALLAYPDAGTEADHLEVLRGVAQVMPDESKHYVPDIVGEDFKSWENGRVILDCGTGCGKNEFIIKKLAGWLVDRLLTGEKNDTILYLCPLNSLHAEMIRRRMEAEIADIGQEAADETHLYKDALVIQTYQHLPAH